MSEHTPAFYDLELHRAEQANKDAHKRIVSEYKTNQQYSSASESNYICTIYDYILALKNTNTIESDNIQHTYEQAYQNKLKSYQANMFQKILLFFR